MKRFPVVPVACIITSIVLFLFCNDLPQEPHTIVSKPDMELVVKGDFPVVDKSGTIDIGVALQLPQQIPSVSISSTCESSDTTLAVTSVNAVDTLFVTLSFYNEGPCTLLARATAGSKNLASFLPLYVSKSTTVVKNPEKPVTDSETDTPENPTILTPQEVFAPENIIAGNLDTLTFTANSAHGETVSLTTADQLDPTVFTVISSGPDVVRIAVNPDAVTGSAQIGIAIGNGTSSDTTIYPVTLKDPQSSLWNSAELPVEATEGIEVQFDLNPFLTNKDVVLT